MLTLRPDKTKRLQRSFAKSLLFVYLGAIPPLGWTGIPIDSNRTLAA